MLLSIKLFKSIFLKRINEGTAHWISQRLASIFLIPLTIFFLFPFVRHVELDYGQIVALYANPYRAILTLSFFSLTLLHFKQGAQVVIEDYIHDDKMNKVLSRLNSVTFWVVNLCIFLALARIMLSPY
jgi:succinate dehydrogenase / fumarate reductase membrane anchor subunit